MIYNTLKDNKCMKAETYKLLGNILEISRIKYTEYIMRNPYKRGRIETVEQTRVLENKPSL